MQLACSTHPHRPATLFLRAILLALLFCSAALPQARGQAYAYMWVTNVTGGITNKSYSGWIELQSFEHAVAKEGTRPEISAITISKSLDRSSVPLLDFCHRGTNIPLVKIQFIKTIIGKPFAYYNLELRDVYLSGYSASSGGDIPFENLSLVYSQINWDYVQFNSSDVPVTDWTAFWIVPSNRGGQRSFPYSTDTDSDSSPDHTDFDDDNDGMPDYWEENFGFNPLDPNDATGDPDGDGLTNLQEYIMGTNPLASNFRVTSIQLGPTTTMLTWTSKPGKTYLIKGSPTVNGTYLTVATVPSAGQGSTSTTISRPAGNRFFIVVEQ